MGQWDIVANWHGLAWGEMGLIAQWHNGTSWKTGMDRPARGEMGLRHRGKLAWTGVGCDGQMGLNVMMGELVRGDLTWAAMEIKGGIRTQ